MSMLLLFMQDNLICLPLRVAQSLGNINQLVLCHRISSSVQLVDPQTTQSELQTNTSPLVANKLVSQLWT